MGKEIFYLCDKKKCRNCGAECQHTSDIEHAINFKKINNNFYEEQEENDSALSVSLKTVDSLLSKLLEIEKMRKQILYVNENEQRKMQILNYLYSSTKAALDYALERLKDYSNLIKDTLR